ncbi:MAG TPA: hypothetical protein PJ991_06530 [Kiritimatiellia bacterium]|nr:hypothetical protein [Kiritimatiellia bacterium]
MNKIEILDEYFMDARSKILDIAAMMDRMDRSGGADDFRWHSFLAALHLLNDDRPEKTRRILENFSDPTLTPLDTAPGKGASGAWPGFKDSR